MLAASVTLAGAAACAPGNTSGNDSNESGSPAPQGQLSSVDPCAVLKPADSTAAGFEGAGKLQPGVDPNCAYRGQLIAANVYKSTTETVAVAEKKPVWAKFERTDVNGRTGATAISSGSTQARLCSVMFDAGGGMIRVAVREIRPGDLDECGEALKVAKLVEPNVPK
jgi:hypothetical protein